jgi:hypothetical protein
MEGFLMSVYTVLPEHTRDKPLVLRNSVASRSELFLEEGRLWAREVIHGHEICLPDEVWNRIDEAQQLLDRLAGELFTHRGAPPHTHVR